MRREVGGHHVGAGPERGAQLLVHVGGLPAAVQAEDRRQAGVAPLEVVDLRVPVHHEAAAAPLGDVVAGHVAHAGRLAKRSPT